MVSICVFICVCVYVYALVLSRLVLFRLVLRDSGRMFRVSLLRCLVCLAWSLFVLSVVCVVLCFVREFVCACLFVCVFVFVCVCLCVCLCVWACGYLLQETVLGT